MPFDSELLSFIHIHTSPDPYSQEGILEKWKMAGDYGQFVHREIDMFLKFNIDAKTIHARNGVNWIKNELSKFGQYHFSELIVYSNHFAIAGTIDLVVPDYNNDGCYLFDWKTAESIEKETKRWGTSPITRNLNDSRYNRYSLQLSMYRYLLEMEFNIPVINQFIVHLKEDGSEIIEAEYFIETVEKILTEKKG